MHLKKYNSPDALEGMIYIYLGLMFLTNCFIWDTFMKAKNIICPHVGGYTKFLEIRTKLGSYRDDKSFNKDHSVLTR